MNSKIIQGNNVDVLKTFPDNTFDSIVTDPPYGIDFLGKEWDANTGALETYQECLRVLKPGGHILAFSAARTYHHLAVTIEQAGFEIRDQIVWIYSSGFPKSQDIGKSIQRSLGVEEYEEYKWNAPVKGGRGNDGDLGAGDFSPSKEKGQIVVTDPEAKQWSGWGTALKPAHEPIVVARKPLDKNLSIAKNCQQWGTGALNIDATRVPYANEPMPIGARASIQTGAPVFQDIKKPQAGKRTATFGSGPSHGGTSTPGGEKDVTWEASDLGRFPSNVIGDIPDYQKYFYCPKVSRAERHIGFDQMPEPLFGDVQGAYGPDGNRMAVGLDKRTGNVGNNHPTVKPIELMKYLIKLVTPKGGHVLDPFNGSGSTGCAAVELDYAYTGIELDPAYVSIAEKRIAAWYEHTHSTTFDQVFEIEA